MAGSKHGMTFTGEFEFVVKIAMSEYCAERSDGCRISRENNCKRFLTDSDRRWTCGVHARR